MTLPAADPVKTAERTLDLFEAFSRRREPMTLSELAAAIGSPVSSTHALVRTLRARGYLYVLDDRKLIYPTKRLLSVAGLIAMNDPIVAFVLPVMTQLHTATDETVILGKQQGDAVVYLEILESSHSIRYSARPGDVKPLYSSAIGKAMLSLMGDAALDDHLATAPLTPVTATTITDPGGLGADIRAGRARNMFVTRGENVADVMALAAVVRIGGGAVGLAVAGPMERMRRTEPATAALLEQAVRELQALDGAWG